MRLEPGFLVKSIWLRQNFLVCLKAKVSTEGSRTLEGPMLQMRLLSWNPDRRTISIEASDNSAHPIESLLFCGSQKTTASTVKNCDPHRIPFQNSQTHAPKTNEHNLFFGTPFHGKCFLHKFPNVVSGKYIEVEPHRLIPNTLPKSSQSRRGSPYTSPNLRLHLKDSWSCCARTHRISPYLHTSIYLLTITKYS